MTEIAGSTGSYVAQHLLHSRDEIAVVDDLSTGRRENIPKGAKFYEAEAPGVETSVNRRYDLLLLYCPPPRFCSAMANE